MAIQLPSLLKTSKKRIPGTRVFDSSRVFADYDSSNKTAPYNSHYTRNFRSTAVKTDTAKAGKVNQPNPTNVHFLFENPRFNNEPVCHASTKAVKKVQHNWWPEEVAKDVKLKPSYSFSSTNRSDFGNIANRPAGITRFGCLKGKRTAAAGIVPVTKLPTSSIKTEKISYEHMFDSRTNRTERGKLPGAFVWDTTHDAKIQPQRRYAKRYFAESDSINMRDYTEVSNSQRMDTRSNCDTTMQQQTEVALSPQQPCPQMPIPQVFQHQKSSKTCRTDVNLINTDDRYHSAPPLFQSKSVPQVEQSYPASPPPHIC